MYIHRRWSPCYHECILCLHIYSMQFHFCTLSLAKQASLSHSSSAISRSSWIAVKCRAILPSCNIETNYFIANTTKWSLTILHDISMETLTYTVAFLFAFFSSNNLASSTCLYSATVISGVCPFYMHTKYRSQQTFIQSNRIRIPYNCVELKFGMVKTPKSRS